MKIIIASKNPVKINAALQGFKAVFKDTEITAEGISVASGVSDQPMSEAETMQGALNRVQVAKNEYPEADYWIGIEGGIQTYEAKMLTFAWVYIENRDGLVGKGRSASFYLPARIVALIKEGKELGDADDIVFGDNNSKQKYGAVGILTKNIITRETLYVPAVTMALIPFINENLF